MTTKIFKLKAAEKSKEYLNRININTKSVVSLAIQDELLLKLSQVDKLKKLLQKTFVGFDRLKLFQDINDLLPK